MQHDRCASRPRSQAVDDVVRLLKGGPDVVAVVLSGAAAIGKSALLERLTVVAREHGACVHPARAVRTPNPVPFAVVVDALGDAMGQYSRVPNLAALGAIIRGGGDGAEIANAATQLVDALQRRGLVVLAVDDATAMDEDSAAWVLRTLRRSPGRVVLLTTTRPAEQGGPAVDALVEWLTAEPTVMHVELGPLTADEVVDAIRLRAGAEPDEVFAAAVAEGTSGHPLLVDQAIVGWLEAGAVSVVDGVAHLADLRPALTPKQRARIIARLVGSDEDDLAVANVVALLDGLRGDRVTLCAAIADMSVERAAAAFDRLAARCLLVDRGDGRYVFLAPILRDVLVDSLGPGEKFRLHYRAAEWLAPRADSPGVLLELAPHLAEAAEPGDEAAITQLVQAADAAQRIDLSLSIRWYGAAVDRMAKDQLDRPLVLSRLARALFLAGEPSDAVEVGRAAIAQLPPGVEQSRSLQMVAEAIITEAIETMTDQAIDFVQAEAENAPDNPRLLAVSAHLLARAGRPLEAEQALAPIADLHLDAIPNDAAISLAHFARASSLLARYRDMRAAVDQAVALAEQASFTTRLVVSCFCAYILAEHGDPDATASIQDASDLLERAHWRLWDTEVKAAAYLDEYRSGAWDDALARIQSLLPRFERTGSLSRLSAARAIQVEILANRGAYAEARRIGCDRIASRATEALRAWAAAGIDLRTGDVGVVIDRLVPALANANMPRARQLLTARLADAYLIGGRLTDAANTAREIVEWGPAAECNLDVLDGWRVYGLATGDTDVLREALDAADRRGATLLKGSLRLALGSLGVEPDTLVPEAYETFYRLGAEPWRRRALLQLRLRGYKIPRHRQPRSAALTEVELQVARLVQQGSRNREIAQTLTMSVKTVEAYLTRIYAKMQCTSRLELARLLDGSPT